MAWITLLAPIVLELLKLLFAAPSDKRADVAASIMDYFAKVRAAIQKAEDTGGDTSDLEAIVAKRPKP